VTGFAAEARNFSAAFLAEVSGAGFPAAAAEFFVVHGTWHPIGASLWTK
jgi:hypothetical protein